MTDLRESVARAVKECREHVAASQDEAADILTSAALRAVADAGFMIVPREPTEAMLKAGGDYQDRCAVLNYGSPADVEGVYLAMIRAAIAAALKEMGAG